MAGRPLRQKRKAKMDEDEDIIFDRISAGVSVNALTKEYGSWSVFDNWLTAGGQPRLERYARAKQLAADKFADEMVAIADEAAGLQDNAAVQAARLRVDTRKWIAAKLKPKVYGDRLNLDAEVEVKMDAGALAAKLAALAAKLAGPESSQNGGQ